MLNINVEMQITSGKFQADLFTMTNDTEFTATASYDMPAAEHLVPSASGIVTLAHNPIAGSVYIKGMAETSNTPTTGQYKIDSTTVGEGASAVTTTTITFYTGASSSTTDDDDVAPGQPVEILYRYLVKANEAKIDNKSAAIGEAILVYPVYTSSDECSIDSSIRGYVILKVYRARVTSQPGLDGSYKTASTFQFTLSTVDPKRDDGNAYSIAYIQN